VADTSLSYPIVTRKEARDQGLKWFFTNRPCKYGHVAQRQTANGTCIVCRDELKRKFLAANREHVREYGRKRWRAKSAQLEESRKARRAARAASREELKAREREERARLREERRAARRAARPAPPPITTVCSVARCDVLVRSRHSELCNTHYFRKRRTGSTDDPVHAMRFPASNGYIVAIRRGHELARYGGQAYEHRFVYYDLHGEGPFACHWCAKEVTWDTLH
jgi:hypothetical protein